MMEKQITKIHYADEVDIPGLLPLLVELGYPTSLENFTIRFKRFLANPGYGVVICQLNKQIAGCIAWSRSTLFVSEAQRFHIEGLVVAHHYRVSSIIN
ncbi:MAG: hypothetical protein RCG15_06975 [Candidatus Rickettsia vulgarisii]